MSYSYLFKIVVVGDHNCGKSCILLRFSEDAFRQDHISTLGVDFKLKTIKLGRDKVRLELWDTAGMERYRWARGGPFTCLGPFTTPTTTPHTGSCACMT